MDEIKNCDPDFLFKCPLVWSDLRLTDDRKIRHCDQCGCPVYLCMTPEEQQSHAQERHCTAIPGNEIDDTGFTLGLPSYY